ncbi:MAG: hypothetical protein KC996_02045 [Phycisphaerales bacterium]|nr:hypothetical protein [Phycisphaerales bacterium]
MKTATKALAGLAVVLSTVSGTLASTDIEQIRSYSLAEAAAEYDAINVANASNIKVAVQVQARYKYNKRDNASTTLTLPDDDTTIGFDLRRTKVAISGDVTENMNGKLQFAFDRRTGMAALEDAVLKWTVSDDLTIHIGQFKPGVLREELVSSKQQLTAERSATNETFNQDYTQGIEFGFGGDQWRATISFNDGFGADNTAFNSASEADYGVSARAEFLVGDGEFGQFKQFTSFRGSNAGGMIGIAAHHQSMGDTNPSAASSTEMTTLTGDFSWVDDGWNFFVAGVWRSMDAGAATIDDTGLVVQGGFFASDSDEIFARYSAVFAGSDNGPGSDQDYSDLTVGWNHYIVPESHAAKFTLQGTYSFDATTTGIVSTSDGHNLLPDSEDGQFGIIAQLQFLF